ncbi:MAG: RNA ligase partner protein [Candidatus Omnitrophota bacterium]|nr:RNA ligase partner protein [Candidatus Omnitrophota bacterium]
MEKNKIVLDTSIFVNPDSRKFFGKTPYEAFKFLLDNIKNKKNISCFMAPSVFDELMKFIQRSIEEEDLIVLKLKPPASYETKIPAMFVYDIINETRARTNKGLRITEKFIRRALKEKHSIETEQEMIKTARDEYRIALREGIIDSKEDFDLLLLAKEEKAFIATSDQGLIDWAQKLGVPSITAKELLILITN